MVFFSAPTGLFYKLVLDCVTLDRDHGGVDLIHFLRVDLSRKWRSKGFCVLANSDLILPEICTIVSCPTWNDFKELSVRRRYGLELELKFKYTS